MKHSIKKRSKDILDSFILSENLIDIWRAKSPTKRKYTWSQHNLKISCRLDYFLVPNAIVKNVTSCDILPSICSDHEMIEISYSQVYESRSRSLETE